MDETTYRMRNILVNIWIFVGLFMLIGPGLLFANRIYPFVMGVPFYYFWNVIWFVSIVASIFAAIFFVWKIDD